MDASNVFLPSCSSPPALSSKSGDTPSPATVPTKTLGVFRLEDDWFGIDLGEIERVTPASYLTRLNLSNGTVLGTVGVFNRLVSVVDLKVLLGLGHTRLRPRSSILVTRVGSYEIGILADEFVDVFFVPIGQVYQYPDNDDPAIERTVTGECVCGNRTISVVAVAGIVDLLISRWAPVRG